jgi:nitroimidazol reductase NimA-like FMN-containing flavoprotein (pyridoxamine 5'-phosphate oxidase superfamily)
MSGYFCYDGPMSDYHIKRAAEIINNIQYITIASTSEDGKPWNTPVFSAFDKDLVFYWFSDKNSQHSQNVRANPEVFLVVYDSTAPEGTGEGVYIQSRAEELQDEESTMSAKRTMDSRIGKNKERSYTDYSGESVLRGYSATAYHVWMNDVEVDDDDQYVRDIRIEIPSESLKAQLVAL